MNCIICTKQMSHLEADIHYCGSCKHYSSDIPPDLTLYDKSYCRKYERYEKSGVNEEVQGIRHKTVFDVIQSGKLLDFGCGSGAFLHYIQLNGYEAKGYDINPHSAYSDISVLFEDYDIVTFWDVLEHLSEPGKIIRGIGAEYVFVCTPNRDDWAGKITEWHHYYPGEHVHYFTQDSLICLLMEAGYEPVGVHYRESLLRRGGGGRNILTLSAKRV